MLNFLTFKELSEKSVLLKISAQASEAGGFLKVLEILRLIFL